MFRKMMGGVAVAAVLLAAGMASAQEFSAARISDNIRTISADEYQGRYPGTEGERMVLAWLQAQYEAMGMQPGGPDGQWLQPVELKRYTPVAGATASWTGPDGQVHALTPGTDIVVRAATNDGRASIRDAGVVFVGHGIHAPERQWDDYGDADVRGKVVVVVGGEPDGERFNGEYATNYQSGAYKADEAFRRGAVGIITLVAQPAASPMWQGALRGAARTRTLTPGAADLEFSGAMPHDTAAAWAAAAGLDISQLPNIADGSFKAVALPGVTLSVEVAETIETLVTHNLLARIPGTEHPEETIIYSAHWDHVGGAEQHPTVTGDNIWNGAWDNASGTIGVLEMARQIKAAPAPKRSIVFAHMAAEEMGLMGAYGYAANPVWPLETTVADINIDMLPLSGPTRDVPIFGRGQNELEDRLQALAEPLGRYVSDDGMPEEGFYYRSDHFPFARMGVPAIMPWHGWDWVDGGRAAGEAAWRAKFAADYHKASDEWSADWDLTSAVENLTLLYHLGLDLANSGDWPGWKPTSEFAVVRARSDAARQ
ncbi:MULTISPECIES: M28 family peptidase [unclassified Brevundimonas]|uniref:M28 family peptidase n=1 Tax=unclassified Brevundimonas TaxID=2622653 RepID=UPI0006FB2331|nr:MULTISPECIES: M28 family peptidase [unclassified Brevundimonas]KQY90105.1 peptidase M28 [Brevundimonas sp. Root1423]KRA22958.1 peptidase M28 [Brevundimonas sp. Root608]